MFGQLPQFHLKVVPKPWVLTLNTQVHSIFLQPCAPWESWAIFFRVEDAGCKSIGCVGFCWGVWAFCKASSEGNLGVGAGGFGDGGYPILGASSMVEMVVFLVFFRSLVVMKNPIEG